MFLFIKILTKKEKKNLKISVLDPILQKQLSLIKMLFVSQNSLEHTGLEVKKIQCLLVFIDLLLIQKKSLMRM